MKYILLLFSGILFSSIVIKSQGQKVNSVWCTAGNSQPSSDFLRSKTLKDKTSTRSNLIDNPNGIIVIPVIFHILFDQTIPGQHILPSVIDAQMARLNADFRMQNSDINSVPDDWKPLRADLQYEFKLACIDPSGAPMTVPGIVYKQIPNSFIFCDLGIPGPPGEVCFEPKRNVTKGDNAWPTDTYLNIWVFDMSSTGYLGDATFPEDRFLPDVTIMINGNPETIRYRDLDGILLDYRVVGDPSPFPGSNRGRVLTHEVGHWLGLRHTYHVEAGQSNCLPPGDFVADTPPQYLHTIGCPAFPLTTDVCTPGNPGIMFMNYMDIANDDCRYFFTTGQNSRARSYFTSTLLGGPPETRYPFIQNYFGIKHFATLPHNVQNNTITVYINNPACLNVTYSYSGPVTFLHSTNQEIAFSVPCNTTGTINLSVRAGTLTQLFGNYIDNYDIPFVNNNAPCTTWPKVYDAVEPGAGVKVDNSGNLLCNILMNNMANNLNHTGRVVSNSVNTYWVQYNKTTGVTDWVAHDDHTAFTMNSGDVQFNDNIQSIATYRNATTGVIIPGPGYVPLNENIVAEDNGVFITSHIDNNAFIDELWVHASPLIHNSITIPAISNYWISVERVIFNPFTKKLFVNYWYHPFFGNMPQRYFLGTYTLNNNVLSNPSYYEINYLITEVNLAEEVFVVDNNGVINRCNYQNNSYTPLLINNNSLFRPIVTAKQTVEDRILAIRSGDNYIYCINTVNSVVTKIAATVDPNNQNPFIGGSFFDGNDVYIAGGFSGQSFTIGNQTMPVLGAFSSAFITKFDVQNDFSLRSSSGKAPISGMVGEKRNQSSLHVDKIIETEKASIISATLSPNPAKQTLLVNIKHINKKMASSFLILVTDGVGSNVVTRRTIQNKFTIDISHLKPGIYYVSISTNEGDKTTISFIKE